MIYKDGSFQLNSDYNFLVKHRELVGDYLYYLGLSLLQDRSARYFYLVNETDSNRLFLNKMPTGILLTLRLIYDEQSNRIGLNGDVICTVQETLEKLVNELKVVKARPNMEEVRRTFRSFEQHNLVVPLEGKFQELSCKFAVLPTITTVISAEKLQNF